MDSGCSVPSEDSTMEDFDPLDYTLPEEIIGIMDQILCFEVRMRMLGCWTMPR